MLLLIVTTFCYRFCYTFLPICFCWGMMGQVLEAEPWLWKFHGPPFLGSPQKGQRLQGKTRGRLGEDWTVEDCMVEHSEIAETLRLRFSNGVDRKPGKSRKSIQPGQSRRLSVCAFLARPKSYGEEQYLQREEYQRNQVASRGFARSLQNWWTKQLVTKNRLFDWIFKNRSKVGRRFRLAMSWLLDWPASSVFTERVQSVLLMIFTMQLSRDLLKELKISLWTKTTQNTLKQKQVDRAHFSEWFGWTIDAKLCHLSFCIAFDGMTRYDPVLSSLHIRQHSGPIQKVDPASGVSVRRPTDLVCSILNAFLNAFLNTILNISIFILNSQIQKQNKQHRLPNRVQAS